MSKDDNKLVRRTIMLDSDTEKAIDEYMKRESLDNRSQAVRHIFKQVSKNSQESQDSTPSS